jgi:uncharacterized membrane protein
MNKSRLEAFSDGVIAIIITIMALELKVPHGSDWNSLLPLLPVFFCYILSFSYVAIYWNNHHHLFQVVRNVNGKILLANVHLLFWLSLIPFVTAWSGENSFALVPVVLYGVVLFMAALAYFILTQSLLRAHEEDSALARALGRDRKGKLSAATYAIAIPLTYLSPVIPMALYALIALVWIIPDQRMERAIKNK